MKKNRRKRTQARELEKEQKPFFTPREMSRGQVNGGFFQPKLEIDPVDSPAE